MIARRWRWFMLAFLLPLISPNVALAQSPCDCNSGSDCFATCYVYGTPHTCGELGMCTQIAQSCSSQCNGQAYCSTTCYTGEYPSFDMTTCGAAGYSCTTPPDCSHNMVSHVGVLSRWQYVEYQGSFPICHRYETRQTYQTDEGNCQPPWPTQYGDCFLVEPSGPFYGETDCCSGFACYGTPWPFTCS